MRLAARKLYRQRNKDQINAANRLRRQNPEVREREKARAKIYRQENKEKIEAQIKAWRKRNPHHQKEKNARYNNANRTEIQAKARAKYAADPERARAMYRSKVQNRPEHYKALSKARYRRAVERFRKHRAALETAKTAPAKTPAEARNRTLRRDELFSLVMAAVPKNLPDFIRDDVVTDIIVAVLERKISVENINVEARKFVTSYHREAGTYKTISLDATMAGRDGFRMIDTITQADLPW